MHIHPYQFLLVPMLCVGMHTKVSLEHSMDSHAEHENQPNLQLLLMPTGLMRISMHLYRVRVSL